MLHVSTYLLLNLASETWNREVSNLYYAELRVMGGRDKSRNDAVLIKYWLLNSPRARLATKKCNLATKVCVQIVRWRAQCGRISSVRHKHVLRRTQMMHELCMIFLASLLVFQTAERTCEPGVQISVEQNVIPQFYNVIFVCNSELHRNSQPIFSSSIASK